VELFVATGGAPKFPKLLVFAEFDLVFAAMMSKLLELFPVFPELPANAPKSSLLLALLVLGALANPPKSSALLFELPALEKSGDGVKEIPYLERILQDLPSRFQNRQNPSHPRRS